MTRCGVNVSIEPMNEHPARGASVFASSVKRRGRYTKIKKVRNVRVSTESCKAGFRMCPLCNVYLSWDVTNPVESCYAWARRSMSRYSQVFTGLYRYLQVSTPTVLLQWDLSYGETRQYSPLPRCDINLAGETRREKKETETRDPRRKEDKLIDEMMSQKGHQRL